MIADALAAPDALAVDDTLAVKITFTVAATLAAVDNPALVAPRVARGLRLLMAEKVAEPEERRPRTRGETGEGPRRRKSLLQPEGLPTPRPTSSDDRAVRVPAGRNSKYKDGFRTTRGVRVGTELRT